MYLCTLLYIHMWNKLSMAERAKYIELGVKSGITSLDSIREVYNSYADGGLIDTVLGWFGLGSSSSTTNTTSNDTSNSPEFTRVRENDSPTKEYSTKLEDNVATRQRARVMNSKKKGISSDEYYIPYTGEELRIPGVGRVSSNTLDSIAVNAERAGIPFEEGLGLAAIETKIGASPNMSIKGFRESFRKQNRREPSKEEVKAFERASLNASYMRNYGGIHPQFLVNDHEWDDRGWEQSKQYRDKLHGIKSPLQHAFTMYKMGIYNQGSSTHTKEVKEKGKALMNTSVMKQWRKNHSAKKKTQ